MNFSAASAGAGLALGTSAVTRGADDKPGKELLELRLYYFESVAKQKAFDDFLAGAAVPALNRAGIGPVGAFKMLKDDNPKLEMAADSPNLYVLTMEGMGSSREVLDPFFICCSILSTRRAVAPLPWRSRVVARWGNAEAFHQDSVG